MRAYPSRAIAIMLHALVVTVLTVAVVGCASNRVAAIPGDGRTASAQAVLDKADRDRAVSTILVATDASLWGAQWVGVLSGVSVMGNVALGFFSLKDIMSAYVKYKMRSSRSRTQNTGSLSGGGMDQSGRSTASVVDSERK